MLSLINSFLAMCLIIKWSKTNLIRRREFEEIILYSLSSIFINEYIRLFIDKLGHITILLLITYTVAVSIFLVYRITK